MSDSVDIDRIETNVKRANLRAQIYIPRRGEGRALRELARAGRVTWTPPTATSLGGWVWIPTHRIAAKCAQA